MFLLVAESLRTYSTTIQMMISLPDMSDTDAQNNITNKKLTFVRRLISTLVLWAIVILALFAQNKTVALSSFAVIILALTIIGLKEFYSIAEKAGVHCYTQLGITLGVLVVLSFFIGCYFVHQVGWNNIFIFEMMLLGVVLIVILARRLSDPIDARGISSIAVTILGILYIPFLLNFMQKIYFYPAVDGRLYLFYFLLVTKFSDSGAYIAGSLFGRHKMCPKISPGKTWEGFAGAISGSLIISLLFYAIVGKKLAGMDSVHSIILGVGLGALAVLGDLVESIFKREAQIKDSGSLFPGVGGILDVLDSLLFNAPIMYYYMSIFLCQ